MAVLIRRVVAPVMTVCVVFTSAVACGGTESESKSDVASTVPDTTASPSIETPSTNTDPTTVPSSEPTDTDIDLADLPGRLVFVGAGCGGDSEYFEALDDAADEIGELGSEDEAMDLIDDLGGMSLTAEICVMSPDGTGLVRVSDPEFDAESPAWTYDGETVMYRSNFQWFVVGPDGSDRRVWDDPTRLPWRLSPDESSYLYEFVDDTNVYLAPVGQQRGGPDSRVVTSSRGRMVSSLRWSPDSTSFLLYKGASECPELWRFAIDTGEETQLTGPGSPSEDAPLCVAVGSGSWSPDGSTILLANYEGEFLDPRPYLIDADGTNPRPLVTDDFFGDPEWMMTDAAWSPDGQYVMIDVFSDVGLLEGEPGLHVIRLSDGRVVPVPVDSFLGILDLAWMPEVPNLQPIPHEDIDET